MRLNVYKHRVRPGRRKRTPSESRIGGKTDVDVCWRKRSGIGGSQWESNPPTTQVPHNGFEARTQRRPRLASGTIVPERVAGAAPEGLNWSESAFFLAFPGRLMVGQRPLEP